MPDIRPEYALLEYVGHTNCMLPDTCRPKEHHCVGSAGTSNCASVRCGRDTAPRDIGKTSIGRLTGPYRAQGGRRWLRCGYTPQGVVQRAGDALYCVRERQGARLAQ